MRWPANAGWPPTTTTSPTRPRPTTWARPRATSAAEGGLHVSDRNAEGPEAGVGQRGQGDVEVDSSGPAGTSAGAIGSGSPPFCGRPPPTGPPPPPPAPPPARRG